MEGKLKKEYEEILEEMDEILTILKRKPQLTTMLRSCIKQRNYVQGIIHGCNGTEKDLKKLRDRCQYMRLVIQKVTK